MMHCFSAGMSLAFFLLPQRTGVPSRSTPYQGVRKPGGYSLLKRLPRFGAGKHGFAVRNAPPIFFLKHQKENAPCTVEKKKCQG